jgi:hypothetical protein
MIPVIDHTTVFGRLYLDEIAGLYVPKRLTLPTTRQLDAARSRASYAARRCHFADIGEAQHRDARIMHFMYWFRTMGNATPAQALAHLFPEDFQP